MAAPIDLAFCLTCRSVGAPERTGAALLTQLCARAQAAPSEPYAPASTATARGEAGLLLHLGGSVCMGGCARPVALSVQAPGKARYLFADIDAGTLDDLLAFAALYAARPDGMTREAERPARLRGKLLARIPAPSEDAILVSFPSHAPRQPVPEVVHEL